ncbi:hypothetical protein [Vibrio campbellii]|uniref:hypothetical protein n=1 Tax=Vibrio campbellii TaxID=680 RepID=UPI0040579D41
MICRNCNDRVFANAIRSTHPELLQQVFDNLLRFAIRTTGEWRPLAWEAIFDASPSEEIRDSWLKTMAETSGLYLRTIGEIEEWLPDNYINSFYQNLSMDETIHQIAKLLLNEDLTLDDETLDNFIAIIEKVSPFHHTSCSSMQKVLTKQNRKQEYIERLDQVRLKILSKRKEFEKSPYKERHKWIY